MNECPDCGDEFETEKGMKIHRTQQHPAEEDQDDEARDQEEHEADPDEEASGMELNWPVIGIAAVGLTILIATTIHLYQDTEEETSTEPSDSSETQDQDEFQLTE